MRYLYDEFKNRFQQYYESVKPITEKHNEVNKLKYHHTFRVVNEIKLLGEHLKLSEESIFFVKLIALFHDVGRFEQFARYQTFSDKDSIDHAELSVQIIRENNLLSGLDEKDTSLVETAILNHNKFAIAKNLTDEQLFFTKLIRDADKLDILYVVTNKKKYYIPDDAKDDSQELNQAFVENIKNYELASYDDINGVLDYVLLRLSWVFDLSFGYTVQQFRERNYLKKMLEQLPESEQKNEIRAAIESFINKKVIVES